MKKGMHSLGFAPHFSVPCTFNVNSECCTLILGWTPKKAALAFSFFQHMYIYKYMNIFGNGKQLCYIVLIEDKKL